MSRSFKLAPARVTTGNRALRAAWGVVWLVLYRPSPRAFHGWRRCLLRMFGARVARDAVLYPSAKIWAPWNLTMAAGSCIADYVDCYSVASITLGVRATVSQYSYLCTGSHDYRDPRMPMPLVVAPIVIAADAWVAADVFVGPGVTIGEGAVVGARSTVIHDVTSWTMVAGSPATRRGERPRFVRDGRCVTSI